MAGTGPGIRASVASHVRMFYCILEARRFLTSHSFFLACLILFIMLGLCYTPKYVVLSCCDPGPNSLTFHPPASCPLKQSRLPLR